MVRALVQIGLSVMHVDVSTIYCSSTGVGFRRRSRRLSEKVPVCNKLPETERSDQYCAREFLLSSDGVDDCRQNDVARNRITDALELLEAVKCCIIDRSGSKEAALQMH
jgi:hypothetical protein